MPGISIPIIDQLTSPSLGLLSRVALPANPYTSFQAFAPPQNILLHLTYGMVFKVQFVPAGWGLTPGAPTVYTPRLAQACVHYTDHSGFDIVQQVTDITYDAQVFIWREPLPALISIYMDPGVTLNLFWLQT
jgi:hypothetical protein